MIAAAISFAEARLTRRAATLAEAHAHRTVLSRTSDARRWRQAHLLWPFFSRKS